MLSFRDKYLRINLDRYGSESVFQLKFSQLFSIWIQLVSIKRFLQSSILKHTWVSTFILLIAEEHLIVL